jgi:PTS system nitrogen regulatory IIA component
MSEASLQENLIRLVERGGVYYNIPGVFPQDVLANLIATAPVPEAIDRADLLKAVLEREALMPTGVGNGIALPHPRNPLVSDPSAQCISIGFLQRPVDWNALDGKPVRTLILIVSASPKLHLRTLSRISFLCQQESFRLLLERRSSREEIVEAILAAEKEWNAQ